MRKLFSIVAFALLTISAVAQETYGKYKMGGEYRDISVAERENGTIMIYMGIMGDYDSADTQLILSGQDIIFTFKEQLIKLKDKFAEWRRVAIRNNVTDYTKPFDIDFPTLEVGWYDDGWQFDFDVDFWMSFIAMTHSDGSVSRAAVAGDDAHAYKNPDSSIRWNVMFFDEDEVQSLINMLDMTKIREAIRNTSDLDALFN